MHYVFWYTSGEEEKDMELLLNLSVPMGEG